MASLKRKTERSSNENNLSQRVLVTGSTRGIGAHVAAALLEDGFDVTLHGKQPTETSAATKFHYEAVFGREVPILYFDVSDKEACEQALAKTVKEHGSFYGVVCNAGITADAAFPALQYEQWRDVMSTNLDGWYHVIHPLIMPMIQQRRGGRIVTLSSISGLAGNHGQVNYSAAKAAVIGASKALAKELASRRITVNCVAPGLVENTEVSDELRAALLANVPMKRACTLAEVAHAVRYLFHPNAAYTTGQTIVLAGGML
jgi:3-oxoacyl-[acyl-carrier protein] reductase